MELYLFITISCLKLSFQYPTLQRIVIIILKFPLAEPYKTKWVILATANIYEETCYLNTGLRFFNQCLFTNLPHCKANVF